MQSSARGDLLYSWLGLHIATTLRAPWSRVITASRAHAALLDPAGRHTLAITKLSEARTGGAWLENVSLDAGGRFLDPPPTPGARTGRRILFIGDSYTAGAAEWPPCSGVAVMS